MTFLNIEDRIRTILPFRVSDLVVEEIALQSSYIPFHGEGEMLFKAGDPALGFYWILKGEVEIQIPNKRPIILGAGSMVGLDYFLEESFSPFTIVNSGLHLDCLFIDRRCYEKMSEHHDFNHYINYMMMNSLKAYRDLLLPGEKMYL